MGLAVGCLPHLQVRGQGCCLAVECLLTTQKALGVQSLAHMHSLSLSLLHTQTDTETELESERWREGGWKGGGRAGRDTQ